ncbi:MAG: triose-phosphate isomerase [Candidatus Paceibacterota bacterium]|jgi:triosephosphate isomerase
MNKLIVANWKMNPTSAEEAVVLAKESDAVGVVIAPPFVFLKEIKETLIRGVLAAQDVFFENAPTGGAYTGEISAAMLKLIGATYVIVGHSERRTVMLETDEIIGKKIGAAAAAGLIPILCVGEGSDIRKEGIESAKQYIIKQLLADLQTLNQRECIIAYEPLWAIGTGENDSPQNAAAISRFIKQVVLEQWGMKNIQVLYGGSVNEKNVEAFAHEADIDGFLIGGASLRSEEFKKMIEIVSHTS